MLSSFPHPAPASPLHHVSQPITKQITTTTTTTTPSPNTERPSSFCIDGRAHRTLQYTRTRGLRSGHRPLCRNNNANGTAQKRQK